MKKIFKHPLILSLLVIVALFFLNYQGLLKSPQDLFFRLFAPAQKIIYRGSLKASNFFDSINSINNLNQENAKLKQENVDFLNRIIQLKEVALENEFLREQMDLPDSGTKQLVLADVVGQDSSGSGKYILINKGEKHGVKKKAAVITAGDILVGQIIELTNSFSKVQLITDSNSRINALIQESRITGLVKGNQGLSLIIDLLPQGQNIKDGEIVITSGLAELFPKGLLIGQIQQVLFSDVQISQKAKIKPAADFNKLEKVFVIIN